MLPVNQTYQAEEKRFRVLWCDAKTVIWIDIDTQKGFPEVVPLAELEEKVMDGLVSPIEDPYLELTMRQVDESSIEGQKREEVWKMLGDHLDDLDLYTRKGRGQLVSTVMQKHKITKQTVYRFLRRYWQRGMCRNAFLPDYVNSGAKGKRRAPAKIKLGRPREVLQGVGSNITPDLERIFRQVIESRLLKVNHPPVSDAYAACLNMIIAAYPKRPKHDLPTLRQFRYFYRSNYNETLVLRRQNTAIDYAKDMRPLLRTSTAEVLGPGHRYQIDATIADIYLVSDIDRSLIVGRPVIYMVIDVFSRMVTGVYIGFEGPSWVSAMVALANTVMDKVEYCRQFDIEIDHDNWPVRGLPAVLLADKGELNGSKVEAFAEGCGVRIENATARRGDAKGIVERYFRTVQEEFKPHVPGVVTSQISRKRGGSDYRLDATLSVDDFTKLILEGVIYHNNFRVIQGYDRPLGMPPEIPSTPVHLWNWGLQHLTGKLRAAPEDLVRINLLPHDFATVSELGIRLFGCFYSCPEVVKEGWFHRHNGNRPAKVLVAYDPRIADHIYLRPDNNLKHYWVCDLMDRSRRFRGMTFWDVDLILKAERRADTNATARAQVEKGELLKKIEAITTAAENNSPTKAGIRKKDLGSQVRENKQAAKQQERRKTAFKVNRPKQDQPAEVVPLHGNKPQDYGYPDKLDILFGDDDD